MPAEHTHPEEPENQKPDNQDLTTHIDHTNNNGALNADQSKTDGATSDTKESIQANDENENREDKVIQEQESEPAKNEVEEEEAFENNDTEKRAAIVLPPSQRQKHAEITPQQEQALHYQEQKRSWRERISLPLPIVKANGQHPSAQTEHEDIPERQTTRLPVPAHTGTAGRGIGAGYVPEAVYPMRRSGPEADQALRQQRHKRMLLRHISRRHMRQGRLHGQRSTGRLWTIIASISGAFLLLFLTITAIGGYASYAFYTQTQQEYTPKVLTLRDLMIRDNLKMYDSKLVPLGQLTDGRIHTTVQYNQISKDVVNATVATEDKSFWTNPGLDLTRIIQAAVDDLTHGRVISGASTITQQLVKNIIIGNQDQNIVRKLQEIILTPAVNSQYSKVDIMEMYLNSIFYGENAYGIDAAANVYFGLEDQPGKPAAAQLDLAQSAMLAGIPNSPVADDPLKHPQAAYNRLQIVLDAMLKNGYITNDQANEALNEAKKPDFYKSLPPSFTERAPHFQEFVLRQLEQTFHMTRQQLTNSGMVVYTTLDISLQDKIQKIMQDHIAALQDHHMSNAAEVLIDFHTGAIRSLLGSIDYNNQSIDGQFDVATQGYRQPGSSFKPYVYVTAFEQGASPGQAIDDNKLTIKLPDSTEKEFTPNNYDKQFHGHMTLRCALQNSLNIPAVKTLQHVGIDSAMKTAKDMGIASYEGTPGYSLVLGGLGVHLLDHTSAYGTFANGGVHVPYYAIDKVVFTYNNQTYGHPKNPGKQVISPQMAYMMTNVLSDNDSRLPEFYRCNVLQLYSNSQNDCYAGNPGTIRPAAAKTGTTNDFRDNLTMGYTTDFVMGVWAGNDDNSPMVDTTGVMGAAPIWHDSMLLAEEGHPIQDFKNPGGLQQATVTYSDGVKSTDLYLTGQVPTSSQSAPKIDKGAPAPTQHTPYCSNFSYAFPPPADDYLDGRSPDPGWW